MTGISLEPRVGASLNSTVGELSSGSRDPAAFAQMLASLSRLNSDEPEAGAGLGDLLALLHAVAFDSDRVTNDEEGSADRGFLGGTVAAFADASPAVCGIAAIFNEFGLLGEPGSSARPAAGTAARSASITPASALQINGNGTVACAGSGVEIATGIPGALRSADAAFWSGPDRGFVTRFAPEAGAAADQRLVVASAAVISPPSPVPASQRAPEPAPADYAATSEGPSAESRTQADRLTHRSATDPAPQLVLSVADQTASLVARLGRLSRDERIRLRQEAERLLAIYGLLPIEVRINGTTDGYRNT